MKAWEENIRKVVPYIPGEQPQVKDIIQLNTNENPYPPSPGVKKAHEEMEVSRFALYPDPAAKELVTALESYHGLDAGQVFVGVGSDDVLALAFLTFFNSDKPILFPDVTYSFYPVWANVYRIPYECPKLTDDFRICPDDYKKENGGVVIANPNAPTSLALSRDEIEEIIAANQDVIVIVDEAYIDFGGESALSLLPKYENLLVVRTYSKSRSMAGMRIGYAMGHGDMAVVHQYAHDLYFESAGTILTLITIGKYLETKSKGKTSEAITKLLNLAPKTVTVVRDGVEQVIDATDVEKGEIFLVKPGESVAVDGIVLEGKSSFDESAITGESIPVPKQEGDTIVSASMNKSGLIRAKATKVGETPQSHRSYGWLRKLPQAKPRLQKWRIKLLEFLCQPLLPLH